MRLTAPRRRGGRAVWWLLLGLVLGGGAGAATMYLVNRGKDGIPGGPRLGKAEELAMIPPDASGFIHVRIRDIWNSEQLSGIREIFQKAGPEAVAVLDEGFVPAPSSIDRLTVVFLEAPAFGPGGGRGGPLPGGIDLPFDVPTPELGGTVVILSFTAPFEEHKFRSSAMPNARQKPTNGKDVWAEESSDLAAYFPSKTTMVLGGVKAVERFVSRLPGDGKYPDGPLTPALALAEEGGRHFVAGVSLKQFGKPGPGLFANAPEDVKALEKDVANLLKAESLAIGLALGKDEMKIDLRLGYANGDDAGNAENAVKPIADFLHTKLEEPRKMLRANLAGKGPKGETRPIKELPEAVMYVAGLAVLNKLDEYLVKPPVKREGNELVASFEVSGVGSVLAGGAAVSVGLLLPAVQKVREAAGRMSSSNNLKQIGLAMHNYHDSNNRLPPQNGLGGFNPNPKATGGLSWRVHILPYIEQDNLYRQFDLTKPWDDPVNLRLIPMMPKVYASPTAPAEPGKTYYKVFVGGGALFNNPPRFNNLAAIPDGTSNTIMTIEGGAPVTWTKPDDIPYDPKRPLPDLKLLGNSRINIGLADGSVRNIDVSRVSEKTLRSAIEAADGFVLGTDW